MHTVLRHLWSILFPMALRYWIEQNVKNCERIAMARTWGESVKLLRNVVKHLIIKIFAEQADRRLCCFTNTGIASVIFTFIRIKTCDIDHALLNNWRASRWSDWLSRVDIITNGDSCVYCFKHFSSVIHGNWHFQWPCVTGLQKKTLKTL